MRYNKRALCALIVLLFGLSFSLAATVNVDLACPTPGNGVGGYTATCDGTAAGNPAVTISAGLAAMVAGDTLNIRGIHGVHESCPGSTTGRYLHTSEINTTLDCTSSTCIMQNSGWTAPGTGERVYVDGGEVLDWTQCTWDGNCDCDAGHTNLTTVGDGSQAACQATWWVTTTDNYVILPSGSPAFRVTCTAGLSELDNSTSGYNRARCSGANDGWRACTADGDCPSGQTCTAAAVSEIDSCTQGGVLFARLGASATPDNDGTTARPANQGVGMVFKTAAKNWTMRGLIYRHHGRSAALYVDPHKTVSNANITFNDVGVFYVVGESEGSDYGIVVYNSTPVTITNSEIAFTGSEGLHTQAACTDAADPCTVSMATVLTVSNNVFRDQDDHSVLGTVNLGTPSNAILADSGGNSGTGDYTGSIVSGNLFLRSGHHAGNEGKGVILENHVEGMVLRDNIFKGCYADCLKLDANGQNVSSNQIFNNLFTGMVGAGNQSSVRIFAANTRSASGNSFYNNTFNITTDNVSMLSLQCDTGSTCSSNLFRNNIMYSTNNDKLTNTTCTGTCTGNALEYNYIRNDGTNPVAAWFGSNYNCSTISTAGTGNKCSEAANPLFVNTANQDFHIQTGSVAKDAGTSTGMPAGRTRDINNTIASSHGFPSYADNQAQFNSLWDIGSDEYSTGGTVTMTISATDSPDPVVPGNTITYTLAYQNTGGVAATGVVIRDTIPSNTSFASATGGGTSDGTTVTWNIGALAAGASGSVQMVVTVTSPLADGTVITNGSYSIISNESSSVSGVADTTTVTSLPVLLVSMSDAPDPVLAGSNITYTIFYSNTGTAGATNVVITDAVPVNTAYVSSTNSGSLSNGVVTWTIGAVNAGTFGSVQMVVTASAGLANGATVTNSTYTLASSELSTINGTPIGTSVIALITSIPQPKFPITSRQNSWTQAQTLLGNPAAAVVQTPNAAQWIYGQASELLTLSTSGTTTDTSANLLPANSIIEAVVARVTTTITVATDWKLGDSAQAARFSSADSTMTAGETKVGLNHMNPTVASADLGPVQSSAAKVRVTTTGTPGAGAIRITVFYRQFIAPTN